MSDTTSEEATLTYSVPFEQVENYVEIDEDSYATIFDLEDYRRGVLMETASGEPDWDAIGAEEIPADAILLDADNRITPATLQPSNRVQGHGGARSKRRRTAVKPLTPVERMDQRCRILRDTGPDAYLPETDVEYEARIVREAIRREERRVARGRPRKGVEVRESRRIRVEPRDEQIIQEATGLNLVDFIEAQASAFRLAKDPPLSNAA